MDVADEYEYGELVYDMSIAEGSTITISCGDTDYITITGPPGSEAVLPISIEEVGTRPNSFTNAPNVTVDDSVLNIEVSDEWPAQTDGTMNIYWFIAVVELAAEQ